MSHNSRKTYTADFKRIVVSYYVSTSCSMTDAATRFEVTTSMLHKWYKRYGSDFCEDSPNLVAEVRRLAVELEKTKGDLDTLRNIVRKKIVLHALSGTDADLVDALLNQ